ncbi:hypothetical protein RJ639_021385 [Escallonia herrerae]|uniref:Uncharacterized protein n=1 Tax=Escallonia herrerae TaxID=1293975 RepID=A0AA88V3C1_9ASTE|nr:hypothetical protein RJ639_021385 [Escallonia herrerae]
MGPRPRTGTGGQTAREAYAVIFRISPHLCLKPSKFKMSIERQTMTKSIKAWTVLDCFLHQLCGSWIIDAYSALYWVVKRISDRRQINNDDSVEFAEKKKKKTKNNTSMLDGRFGSSSEWIIGRWLGVSASEDVKGKILLTCYQSKTRWNGLRPGSPLKLERDKLQSGKSPVAAVEEAAANIAASARPGENQSCGGREVDIFVPTIVDGNRLLTCLRAIMTGRGGWPEENVMNGFDTEEDFNDMEEDPGPIDEESEGLDLDGLEEEEEEEIKPDSMIDFEWNGEGLGKVVGVRDFWEAKCVKVVGERDRQVSQLEKLKVNRGQQIKRLERGYKEEKKQMNMMVKQIIAAGEKIIRRMQQPERDKMQSGKSPAAAAKETAANIAASAKSGLEKTKAVVEEKVEKVTASDPVEKDMATMRKEDKIRWAELKKQEAYSQNAVASMDPSQGYTAEADPTDYPPRHNAKPGHGTVQRPTGSQMQARPDHGPVQHVQPSGYVTEDVVGSHYPVGTGVGVVGPQQPVEVNTGLGQTPVRDTKIG